MPNFSEWRDDLLLREYAATPSRNATPEAQRGPEGQDGEPVAVVRLTDYQRLLADFERAHKQISIWMWCFFGALAVVIVLLAIVCVSDWTWR